MRWFWSPSSQNGNGSHGFLEEVWNNHLVDLIIPIMARHGEINGRNDPSKIYTDHWQQARDFKADRIVIPHTNAIMQDALTWQTAKDGITIGCLHPENHDDESTKLALLLYSQLNKIWPTVGNGVILYTFSELIHALCPVIYPENGYHDNPTDQAFMISHIQQIAIAYCKACLESIGKVYDGLEELRPIYRVQVGAFHNIEYAIDQRDQLIAAGYEAYIRREEK